MISDAGGYECVDLAGIEAAVRGAIMPKRQGGAKLAMKYEDLLFLLEGKLERSRWRTGWTGERAKPGGILMSMKEFLRAAKAAGRGEDMVNLSDFVRNDAPLPSGVTEIWSKETYQDAGEYDPCAALGGRPELEEIGTGATALMRMSDVESAHRNLARLTRTLESVDVFKSGRWREWTVAWFEKDGEEQSEETLTEWQNATPGTVYDYSGTPNGSTVREIEATVSDGVTRRWASSAKLLMKVHTIVDGGVSTERGKEWLDMVAVDCQVADGGAISWNADPGTIAKQMLSRHGEGHVTEPTRTEEGTTKGVTVIIQGAHLCIDHAFPATPE